MTSCVLVGPTTSCVLVGAMTSCVLVGPMTSCVLVGLVVGMAKGRAASGDTSFFMLA